MSNKMKINVAIVGLGFGAEFIPIYMNHPDAAMAAGAYPGLYHAWCL